MRDDPELDAAAIHALNQWMLRGMDVQLRGPHLLHAGHHTWPSSTRRSRSSSGSWPAAPGSILIRPAPVLGLPGPALARAPRVRPYWQGGGVGDPGGDPRLGPRLPALHQRVGGQPGESMASAQPRPFMATLQHSSAPITDTVASLIAHGTLARLPNLGSLSSRTARLGPGAARRISSHA